MIAIVTAFLKKNNRHRFSFLPYRSQRDVIGEEPVVIYSLSNAYRPFLQKILTHLAKKHSRLIVSDEITPNPVPDFFPRIREILPLLHKNEPQKIAVLCQKEDKRLFPLLQALSPYAQSVSLVTEDTALFEKISQKALWELGLTLNQRTLSDLKNPDLTLLLSGHFDLSSLFWGYFINLSSKEVPVCIPTLTAVSNQTVSSFLARHPYLAVNPAILLAEEMPVTNLIWKNCEKIKK